MNDKLAIVFHIGTISAEWHFIPTVYYSTDIVKSIPLNFPKIIYTPPKLFFLYYNIMYHFSLYIFMEYSKIGLCIFLIQWVENDLT